MNLPSPAAMIAEAEARRDQGAALAADRRPRKVLLGELALLDALAGPGATATTDSIAADPTEGYADGGKWVGAIVLHLLREGIIEEVGAARSLRPSRHRGRLGVYMVRDRNAAEFRRAELRRILAALPEDIPGSCQPTFF